MAWALPRLLRRVDAALVHTQYARPARRALPVRRHRPRPLLRTRRPRHVLDATALVFRRVVPRAVRQATRVLTVSERSKQDLVELYGTAPAHVVVTPNGVDPAFGPGPRPRRARRTSSRSGRSSRGRTSSRRSPRLTPAVCRSSSSGRRRTPRPPADSGPAAPSCSATSRSSASPSSTAGPPASCRPPATRASACPCSRRWSPGRPVVTCPTRRCSRSSATPRSSPERTGSRRRSRRPAPSATTRCGRARARRRFHMENDGRGDRPGLPGGARVRVSAVVVSHGHAGDLDAAAPRPRRAGGRGRRRREHPRLGCGSPGGSPRARERAPALPRGERQPRHRGEHRRCWSPT